MLEQQINGVRRTLGIESGDEKRAAWLAPIAVVVAGVGGLVALIVSRLRGRPSSASATKPAAGATKAATVATKPKASRSRSAARKPSASGTKRRSTGARTTASRSKAAGANKTEADA